ncbi:MAG: hypothetical protein K2I68_05930, partial [Bacteroidales bacterium]|nr:hypothetical protein [Bacteroidales bacterium]
YIEIKASTRYNDTTADYTYTWYMNGTVLRDEYNRLYDDSILRYYPPVDRPITEKDSFMMRMFDNGFCPNQTKRYAVTNKVAGKIHRIGVEAGPDGEVMLGKTYQLYDDTVYGGRPQWTTSGNGTFSDASALHPVYTPGSLDKSMGYAMLYLTSSDDYGCSITDSLKLTVLLCDIFTYTPLPDTLVCRGDYCFDNALQMPDFVGGIAVTYRVEGAVKGLLYEDNDAYYCLADDEFDDYYYYLTVTTSNGCEFRDTVELSVLPMPVTANLVRLTYPGGPAAVAMCPGDTATLTIQAANYNPDRYNYQWSTGATSASIRFTTDETDSVTLTVTDRLTGCSADTVVKVLVRNRPLITTGPDTVICPGGAYRLPQIRLVNPAILMTAYEWQEIGQGVIASGAYHKNANQPEVLRYPTADTTYYVARLDGDGLCGSAPDTVMVAIEKLSLEVSPSDTTVCYGATVKVSTSVASSAAQVALFNAGGGAASAGTYTYTALHDTMYIVSAVSQRGCVVYDTARIHVYAQPSASDKTLQPANLCAGDEVLVSTLTQHADYDYNWTVSTPAAPGLYTSTGDTLRYKSAPTDSVLNIHLELKHKQGGCLYTADTTVKLFVMANIAPMRDTLVCEKEYVRLFPTGNAYTAAKGYTITWYDSLHDAPVTMNAYGQIRHTYSNTYYRTVKHNATGCVHRDTVHVDVDSLPLAILPDTLKSCTGTSVYFDLPEDAIRHYRVMEWTDKYVSTSIQDPYEVNATFNYGVEPMTRGVSVAYLYVEGTGACSNRVLNDSMVVTLGKFELGIPALQSACSGGDTISVTFTEQYRKEASSYYWVQDGVKVLDSVIYRTGPSYDSAYTYVDSLVAVSKDGCERKQAVTFNFYSHPKIRKLQHDTICAGTTLWLEALCQADPTRNPGLKWYEVQADGSMLQIEDGECEVEVTPMQTTTYIALNIPGVMKLCNNNDTVTIVVEDAIETTLGFKDTNLCERAPVELAFIESNSTLSSFQWTDSATGKIYTDSVFVDTISETHTYYFDAETSYGCTHRDTVHVYFGLQAYTLYIPDTAKCPGEEMEVHVIGPRPTDNLYPWMYPDSSIHQITDSIFKIKTADTTERYVLMLQAEGACATEVIIQMNVLHMPDTVMCDFSCITLTLPPDTLGQKLASAKWYLLDSLTFTHSDTTVAHLQYAYADTTITIDTTFETNEGYRTRVIPYPYAVKERDTVTIHAFCDSIFTGGHTYLTFDGYEQDEEGKQVTVLREMFAYEQTTVECREAEDGKKIVCDTIYDVYTAVSAIPGLTVVGQRVPGSERAVNCREVDTVCVVTYKEYKAKDGSLVDTLKAELDCNPIPEGKIRVCDSIFKEVPGLFLNSPKKIVFVRTENCQDVDPYCIVTYEKVPTDTGFNMVATIDCGGEGKVIVCDSVFILKPGLFLNSPKKTIFDHLENCRIVDESCTVSYERRDISDALMVMEAKVECGTTSGKKKICDSIYKEMPGEMPWDPYVLVFTGVENCREVEENCTATY